MEENWSVVYRYLMSWWLSILEKTTKIRIVQKLKWYPHENTIGWHNIKNECSPIDSRCVYRKPASRCRITARCFQIHGTSSNIRCNYGYCRRHRSHLRASDPWRTMAFGHSEWDETPSYRSLSWGRSRRRGHCPYGQARLVNGISHKNNK